MNQETPSFELTGRRKLIANLLLSLFSLIFSLSVAEIAARFYLIRLAPEQAFIKYASLDQLNERYRQPRLVPHRYLGFYPNPGYEQGKNSHNSLGFRGEEITMPKPDGVFRIVCFGGSTTYSTAVEDYRESYPYQLQEYLRASGYTNLEVINAGVASFTSWETLINFEFRALDLDPDLIIIYHGINDVDPRLVLPEAYVGDNSGFSRRTTAFTPPFWENSTLLRMALIYSGFTEPHNNLRKNFIETPGSYYGDEFLNQIKNDTYPSGLFRNLDAQRMLEINQPVYYARNLRNLIAIAQDYDIQAALLTFTLSPHFPQEPRAFTPEFAFGIAQNNETLFNLAAEMNVPIFDFAAVMPTAPQYFADGIHFTAEGNRLRAQLIGDFIISQNFLPVPAGETTP